MQPPKPSDAFSRPLMLILAGLVFTLIDVRIGAVQLFLPDPLGYLLIALGLGPLVPLERRLRLARAAAVLLVLLSIGTLVEQRQLLAQDSDVTYTINRFWPIEMTVLVVDMLLVYWLVTALRELALRRARFSLAEPAKVACCIYVTVAILKVVAMAVYLRAPPVEFYYIIPLTGLDILAAVLLLEAIFGFWRKRADVLPPEPLSPDA